MSFPVEAMIRTPWGGPWRRFVNPVSVLQTNDPAEVLECLNGVEARARRDGLFAAGFVTYEAAPFGPPGRAISPEGLPLVLFGLFPPDHVTSEAALPSGGRHRCGPWTSSISRPAYIDAIAAIKDRIAAGDTYQINLTFRLTAPFDGDPRSLMRSLCAAQAGQWAAYVDAGTHAICSASPELFFTLSGHRIECRPMKGTAPRGLYGADDRRQGERLRASEKNRAENVMVVDMVRNDLGRLARFGSVEVTSLFELERFPAHWQMTSSVAADLADAAPPRLGRLFEALFPSGSITGAPKHRSMAIIQGLEQDPRGLYTGAIGYLAPDGDAHFNVAIRTVVIDHARGTAEFGVGSGIVWDSVDRDEYEECLLKASIVLDDRGEPPAAREFDLLETMKWTAADGFVLLDRHLARLRESADYFAFAVSMPAVEAALAAATRGRTLPARVRLRVAGDGTAVCDVSDLTAPPAVLRGALAAAPIDARDPFLYHKTTRRHVYDTARASRPDADAVILWNEAGEITEGTTHNIIVRIGGRTLTPPVECGLLAGTLRAEMLDAGEIETGRITIDDLSAATSCWLINSVSGSTPLIMDERHRS